MTTGGSTWAVVLEDKQRIVWAKLTTDSPPADPAAVTAAAVREAVPAFRAPMKRKP